MDPPLASSREMHEDEANSGMLLVDLGAEIGGVNGARIERPFEHQGCAILVWGRTAPRHLLGRHVLHVTPRLTPRNAHATGIIPPGSGIAQKRRYRTLLEPVKNGDADRRPAGVNGR